MVASRSIRHRYIAAGVGIVVALSMTAFVGALDRIDRPASVAAPAERLGSGDANPSGTHTFTATPVATFDSAWAMAFLPSSRLALITERPGHLILRDMQTGVAHEVAGLPVLAVGGQGGLGDIIAGPGYDGRANRTIILSWAEAGTGETRGAAVGIATLDLSDSAAPRLIDLDVIWRQTPKVTGSGHYGHRLALSPDQRYLFITSGDRQKFSPAQDPTGDLGKIIRIDLAARAMRQWSLGHRNPLGIAFAPDGLLWETEMGPKGGDELNLITEGGNYGWPNVSNGSNYDGSDIPDHSPGDGYLSPKVSWNPSISPGSLMIYRATASGPSAFPNWVGDAFIGALSGQALIRVDLDGERATKAEQWPMGARIRVVVEDPHDGTIWLIEDGSNGRLIHLTPT